MEQNSSIQKLNEVVLSTDYFVKISKNGAINFCSGQFQTVISKYKYIVPVLPVINQTLFEDRVFQMFRTVAQTVISRYNYGRERSQSRKYNITVFYQCINQKGPWVLQAICLVHLYWMVADIRRQHPIVLSKKIIIRMYRKRCKINQEISGNPKIKQGIYSGWILYVRELPMAVGNLGLQRQILSATHQLLYSTLYRTRTY